MTVTPLATSLPPVAPPVTPNGAAASTGPGAGDSTASGFAALVSGLIAGQARPMPAATVVTLPEGATAETEDMPPPEESEPDATLIPGLAALVVAVVPAPVGQAAPRTDAPVVSERPAAEPAPALDVAKDVGAPPMAPATAPHQQSADSTEHTSPALHTPVTPATSVAVGTGSTAPAASSPAPAATNPVTRQVIPEVSRMVSQGNGTHRLTMTLQPEALGEVRVTLTVREGEVRVRFAAGEDAQRALVEGAPELRRVLELAGAGDTRVVVRDLAQAAVGSPSQTTPSHAHSGGEGRGDTAAPDHGRAGPQDQHAGTRAGTTARDGLSDGAPTPGPEPVRHARASGVDLTM